MGHWTEFGSYVHDAVLGSFACGKCRTRYQAPAGPSIGCPSCGAFVEQWWIDFEDIVERLGWHDGVEVAYGSGSQEDD